MATLMFTKEFLEGFTGLEPQVRQKVRELPDKFEDAVHTGVHLEKLSASRDDRIRTVRVDQFWRGVVVRLGDARYALLRVMPHDDAIAWAMKQRFGVNPVTGLVEILDVPTVEAKVDAVLASVPSETPSLFASRRDRDFTAVGVDEELIPLLRRIVDEAELYAIANYLPDAQSDAVLMLADGKSPEEVWAEIARDYELAGDDVDTDDIDTAINQPGSRSHFVVTTNDSELVDLLSGDFEAWRTFLHPTQRAVAYRPIYKGPAKITGGAGTGKTVVAVHRARYLAQRLIESGGSSGRILFATYTNSLATNLDHTLRTFCTPEEYRHLQVSTVDAFARRTLSAAKSSLKPVPPEKLRETADQAASMAGLDQFRARRSVSDHRVGAGNPGPPTHQLRCLRHESSSGAWKTVIASSAKGSLGSLRAPALGAAPSGQGHVRSAGGRGRRSTLSAGCEAIRPCHRRRGSGPPSFSMALVARSGLSGGQRSLHRGGCPPADL